MEGGKPESYDVILVGGGISGASLLYVLSHFTDIPRILLLEKAEDFATLNSNSRNNSQTLHFGDIETNYSVAKATETKAASQMVLKYTRSLAEQVRGRIIQRIPKMVLAVGREEIDQLDQIYLHGKSDLFPSLKRIGKQEIGSVEPNTMKGRSPEEKVEALLSDSGYMVDFGALTESFVENSRVPGKEIDILLGHDVQAIDQKDGDYRVRTNRGTFDSSFVSVDAGSLSLYLAKSLGYGEDLILFLIGGVFFYSPRVLNGKVYRVQKHGIPFAAVHGDPEFGVPDKTRFGPTAEMAFELERGHPRTFKELVETEKIDEDTLASLVKIIEDNDVRAILERSALYHLPYFGKHLFLEHEVKPIVPSLHYNELERAKGIGGIRPQIVNKKKRELELGEAIIRGKNIIFNVTPSPGATACLQNAYKDATYIADSLGAKFDSEAFRMEIGPPN